jgi:hypothetical protein
MHAPATGVLLVADQTAGAAFALRRMPLFEPSSRRMGWSASRPVAAVVAAWRIAAVITAWRITAVVAPCIPAGIGTLRTPGTLRWRRGGSWRLAAGRGFGSILWRVRAFRASFAARIGSASMTLRRATRAIGGWFAFRRRRGGRTPKEAGGKFANDA